LLEQRISFFPLLLKRKKKRIPNKKVPKKKITATFEKTTIGNDPTHKVNTGRHLNCSNGLKIETNIKSKTNINFNL